MYFNINDYLLRNIMNYSYRNHHQGESHVQKNELYNTEETLQYGNHFKNLYKPYKNHHPKPVKAHSERERLLQKIQEVSLCVNDLGLYLNMYPQDEKMYEIYKRYSMELKQYKDVYSKQYQSLENDEGLEDKYTWYKGPWPWEGSK